MYKLLLSLLLLAACSCTAPIANSWSVPITSSKPDLSYTYMADRTVHVEAICDTGKGWGSGVIIQPNVIATAKHVVDGEDCFFWIGNNVVQRRELHPVADVALIYMSETAPFKLHTELADTYLGQPLVAMGYPKDYQTKRARFTVTRGHVASHYDNGEFRFTAPVVSGSSGGPLFDERGRLLGVTVSLWWWRPAGIPYDGQYFAEPVARIQDLLRRN